MKRIVFVVLLSALAGCATTGNIQEFQDGTYIVMAHGAPSGGAATRAEYVAYDVSQRLCDAKMQRLALISSVSARGNVTLHIDCQ